MVRSWLELVFKPNRFVDLISFAFVWNVFLLLLSTCNLYRVTWKWSCDHWHHGRRYSSRIKMFSFSLFFSTYIKLTVCHGAAAAVTPPHYAHTFAYQFVNESQVQEWEGQRRPICWIQQENNLWPRHNAHLIDTHVYLYCHL